MDSSNNPLASSMRTFLALFLSTFSICTFGQSFNLVGTWKSEKTMHARQYTFNTDGTAKTDELGDLSEYHFSGRYSILDNHIIIKYDTLVYSYKKSISQNDTLLILNNTTLKVNNRLYVFNQERKEIAFSVDSTGLLTYKTKNFGDSVFIQKFRFNRWIVVDTIVQTGEFIDLNNYPLMLHSGSNMFRIHTNFSHRWLKQFEIISPKEKIKLNSTKIKDKIIFSRQTYYELYDKHGKLLQKGVAETVDCTSLPKGRYFLNFDNSLGEIKKI